MSRERELLEWALAVIDGVYDKDALLIQAKIRAFLSTPEPEQDEEPVCWICTANDVASPRIEWKKDELSYWLRRKYEVNPLYLHPAPQPKQDEPVNISDKFEPTIGAILPNGAGVSNVYEAYEAGLKEGKLQDEEPIYMFRRLGQDKFVTCSKEQFDELSEKSIFETRILHPAPRKPFVRLSEEEVSEILSSAHTPYEAICAAENRLERKNK